ncbi:TraB/GumN family protein [Halocatena salina]|uniref:TraB/GumN family protein n=1 Tax=Halocatena salina TaxID=2934340 RepID=A0A8U0A2C4_9EURY|nr:TraB/GumN family protein [Halocatena salina]UPM42588.1 TraB/GumN family protein [Halocatena salina]
MSSRATEDGSVHVVGTAHVSEQSVEEVEEVIEEERPDVVAVELDEGRYRQMKGEQPDDLEAGDLLHGNTVFQFLAYWLLSYVQSRLGDEFDIDPGAEMMAAVETAEEFGLGVALVDRDIQVTIQRFWARLSVREKLRLISELGYGLAGGPVFGLYIGLSLGLFGAIIAEAFGGPFVLAPLGTGPLVSVFDTLFVALAVGSMIGLVLTLLFGMGEDPSDTEEIEEFDLEELTDRDVVTAMMEEFRRFSPGGAEALIDERDAYIAHKLVALQASGKEVVAVVGAGHRAGIEGYLDAPETLPPMESLVGEQQGSRFSWYKLVGYLFTLVFLAFFVLIAMAGVRSEFFLKLVGAWFLFNGLLTFTLSRLGGAHWSSATVGGALAWLTSLNPMLAPGWFAGYVELRYTSVNVSDISTLNEILDDEESPLMDLFARMRRVPLFKLILVVALTNVGSIIGTWLFVMAVPYIVGDVSVVQLMLEGAQRSFEILMNGLRGVL